MNKEISMNDLLKAAMQVEAIGEAFYRKYAFRAESVGIRNTFDLLAAEEQSHFQKFQEMAEALRPEEAGKGISKENRSHISKMINEAIFNEDQKADNLLKKIKNARDALQSALALENNSIKFYEMITPEVSPSDREAIKMIIAEEQKHLQTINDLVKDAL